jgi:hypothetical protein
MSAAPLTDFHVQQIKRIAPYLDAHVLLNFLKNHAPGTERL